MGVEIDPKLQMPSGAPEMPELRIFGLLQGVGENALAAKEAMLKGEEEPGVYAEKLDTLLGMIHWDEFFALARDATRSYEDDRGKIHHIQADGIIASNTAQGYRRIIQPYDYFPGSASVDRSPIPGFTSFVVPPRRYMSETSLQVDLNGKWNDEPDTPAPSVRRLRIKSGKVEIMVAPLPEGRLAMEYSNPSASTENTEIAFTLEPDTVLPRILRKVPERR